MTRESPFHSLPFLPALFIQFCRPFQLTPGGPHLISKLSSKGSTAPVHQDYASGVARIKARESRNLTPTSRRGKPAHFMLEQKPPRTATDPYQNIKASGERSCLSSQGSKQHSDRRRQGVLSRGPCMSSDRDRIKPPSSRVEGPSINDVATYRGLLILRKHS